MRRRKPQPWFTDIRARVRFERGARLAYPGLRCTATGRSTNARVIYTLTVDVPEYDRRRVVISLANCSTPTLPDITVDGPTESPHRYSSERLCVEYPDDPPDERWAADDGLLALIDLIRAHLFREAYWRETGIWAGPEAPHEPKEAGN
jgi:hypothetical protein